MSANLSASDLRLSIIYIGIHASQGNNSGQLTRKSNFLDQSPLWSIHYSNFDWDKGLAWMIIILYFCLLIWELLSPNDNNKDQLKPVDWIG